MAGDISEYRCFAPLAFWKWMSSCRDGMMASHNISVSFSKGLTNASQNSMTSKNLLKAKLFRPESTFFWTKRRREFLGVEAQVLVLITETFIFCYISRKENTKTQKKRNQWYWTSHSVWKAQKKSHSTERAKRATFTFWVDKS